MLTALAQSVALIANLLVGVIIINSLLSFFLSPYHPLRMTLDRFLEPLYAPIRRIVPPAGMFDFSPLILIVIIQILSFILVQILRSI